MASHYVRLLSSLQLSRVLTKAAVVAQVNVKHLVQLLQSKEIISSLLKISFLLFDIYYCGFRR